jgi:RHS repeat-associated protein
MNSRILKSSVAIVIVGFLLVSVCFAKPAPKRLGQEDAAVVSGSATTLLPDGLILVSGGQGSDGKARASLSIKDRLSGAMTELTVALRFARAGHTATVLPDGTVLFLGGIGSDGKVVSSAEVFDPASATVRTLNSGAPESRAFHTATVLTDGRVLIAGGVLNNGTAQKSLFLWDPRTGKSTTPSAPMVFARHGHTATLLSDGRVLLAGGKDDASYAVARDEVFDPQGQAIVSVDNLTTLTSVSGLTEVRASSPQDGAQDVALDALISMRFSKPVLMSSINERTVSFEGPAGIVSAKIVPAESGMLAFITPNATLQPGSVYTVKISGALDAAGQNMAYSEFSFTTAGTASGALGDEEWLPTSDWQTHRAASKFESLPDLEGHRGETALAGQVLKLNGEPLERVTLQIGNRKTQSDDSGRFLLTDVPEGHQVLVIEGRNANSGSKKYGRFEFGAEIKKGVTNSLGFKIWMPALDMAHEVTIPSPTTKETVVSTPMIPGLELHIPANTVITDSDGKVVTKITITPIPLDRPPFPLPFVKVPVYFTIQPGGAYIDVRGGGYKGARLIYPNTDHLLPGIPFAFWNYSADQNGWQVYGRGLVSRNGLSIIPDPGVVIYEFSGAMVGSGSSGPGQAPPAGKPKPNRADPVDLSTGLFIYEKTDLALSDVIPLALTRTYRPNDSWSRPFGIGTTHTYEMYIGGNGQSFGTTPYVDLILPDGSRIHFIGVGTGPSYTSYLHSSVGSAWYGAVLSGSPSDPNHYTVPGNWYLQVKDGTIYTFPGSDGLINPGCQALIAITDRYGNNVKITRNADTNCTIQQITSPSGRYIQFQYDTSFRVTQATDNIGRTVHYAYDGSGRLQTVTDANGGTWTYTYDSSNRMLTIQDARNIVYLTNQYDSSGRVTKQTQADTGFYQFAWTPTANATNVTFSAVVGGSSPPAYDAILYRYCSGCTEGFPALIAQVDVTDPQGNVERVVFNANGYTSSDTRALGKSEQQVTTYTYYADNLIGSITDQLGRVTSYDYDLNGNPTTITALSGTGNAVTTTISYDGTFSQPLSVTDPLNHTTTFAYDGSGNLTTATDALGHSTTFGYNSKGLVTSVTDGVQNSTSFAYDFSDLIGITDALQNTTSIFYDGAGRMASTTDPLGHNVKYQYNNLNQITQMTDPLQGITSLSYDANGNLLTVQDAKQQGTGNKTTYAYNNMDRVQTRTDQLSRQESFSYDLNGNLSSFTDRRGKVTTLQYDGLNRNAFVGYGTTAGPVYESTTSYSYDGGNRLSSVVDSLSGTITPVFDGLDRLTSETTPQGSIAYGYDNASRRTSTTVTGQTAISYGYDNANRLQTITQGSSTTTIAYDNANRRGTLTLPNGLVVTYGYDNDSRVTSMSYQFGSSSLGNLTYAYDANGRRTQGGGSFARTGFPQAVSAAQYDVANELTQWNGANITYDANGNIVNDGAATYSWDARNQLSGRGTLTFQYDGYGRRTLNAAGNKLLYQGFDVSQELSGTTPIANRIVGGVDEFFVRSESLGAYSPLADVLGSTLALVDSSGNLATQYTYDPFGNTVVVGSASGNPFQYTGRENDNNVLYYYRARYYSPTLQRFISEDPIEFDGGINVYAYVEGDPIDWTDPFGMRPGTKYRRLRCAGWNSIRDINQTSKRLNREYGGWVYRNADGTYSYGVPVQGTASSVNPRNFTPIPSGATRAAIYHTHAAYDSTMNPGNPAPGTPGYNWQNDGNEIFSPPDKQWSDYSGGGYLGTPQGTTEEYVPSPGHPSNGTVRVLTGRNCGC